MAPRTASVRSNFIASGQNDPSKQAHDEKAGYILNYPLIKRIYRVWYLTEYKSFGVGINAKDEKRYLGRRLVKRLLEDFNESEVNDDLVTRVIESVSQNQESLGRFVKFAKLHLQGDVNFEVNYDDEQALRGFAGSFLGIEGGFELNERQENRRVKPIGDLEVVGALQLLFSKAVKKGHNLTRAIKIAHIKSSGLVRILVEDEEIAYSKVRSSSLEPGDSYIDVSRDRISGLNPLSDYCWRTRMDLGLVFIQSNGSKFYSNISNVERGKTPMLPTFIEILKEFDRLASEQGIDIERSEDNFGIIEHLAGDNASNYRKFLINEMIRHRMTPNELAKNLGVETDGYEPTGGYKTALKSVAFFGYDEDYAEKLFAPSREQLRLAKRASEIEVISPRRIPASYMLLQIREVVSDISIRIAELMGRTKAATGYWVQKPLSTSPPADIYRHIATVIESNIAGKSHVSERTEQLSSLKSGLTEERWREAAREQGLLYKNEQRLNRIPQCAVLSQYICFWRDANSLQSKDNPRLYETQKKCKKGDTVLHETIEYLAKETNSPIGFISVLAQAQTFFIENGYSNREFNKAEAYQEFFENHPECKKLVDKLSADYQESVEYRKNFTLKERASMKPLVAYHATFEPAMESKIEPWAERVKNKVAAQPQLKIE